MVTAVRIPLVEEIYTGLSPLDLFELFRHGPYCFILDSSMDPQKLGRYSFMGSTPFLVMSSRGRKITISEEGMPSIVSGNPFDVLGEYLEKYHLDAIDAPIPFVGGAVGYLSYDLCYFIEKLPKTAVNDLKLPESYFGFYDLILAHDNLLNKTYIVSTGFPEQEAHRLLHAQERLNEFKEKLAQLPHQVSSATKAALVTGKTELKGNFTHGAYVKAVERARQYIIDGDIFEVNISQRFEAHITIPPYELYRRLRAINPAPFASYLSFDKVTIVSASPERFLKVQGDWVETRPIKGTVRRGKTPQEDSANARELCSSIKDHAENMMIVDLERNDLGRVCRYGSVRVSELAILETFPTVFHLTSTIVGRLNADKNRYDLLKATFPGGSITGAPKVRAMEIIDELEPTRRDIYTGSIGYLSFDGNMDINIVIRTFIIKGNKAYFQVGGAVVYDSNPESEYQETLDKGRALVNALNTAEPK
jgi:para-aminobenzoate synthetase component I